MAIGAGLMLSWALVDVSVGPHTNARRTLKYDPHSNQTSLVVDDFWKV